MMVWEFTWSRNNVHLNELKEGWNHTHSYYRTRGCICLYGMDKRQKPFKSLSLPLDFDFLFFCRFSSPLFWSSESSVFNHCHSLFLSFPSPFAHTKSNIFASRSRSLIIYLFFFFVFDFAFCDLLKRVRTFTIPILNWRTMRGGAGSTRTTLLKQVRLLFLLGSSIFSASHFGFQWLWRCDIDRVKWLSCNYHYPNLHEQWKMHIGPLSIRLNCMLLWDELTMLVVGHYTDIHTNMQM